MGWRRSWYTAFRVSVATSANSLHSKASADASEQQQQQFNKWLPPLFTRPKTVSCEGRGLPNLLSRGTASKRNISYDFIILGHGRAGQAALACVRELCPQARIGVVDPFLSTASIASKTLSKGSSNSSYVDFYPGRSIGLSPRQQHVLVESSSSPSTPRLETKHTEEDDICLIYKYGVLLATGSHGAPPPHYLMDTDARDRVLELRPTTLPMPGAKPPRSPRDLFQYIQLAVTEEQSIVAILGSGWDAMELAARCTFASSKRRNNRPVLIMGASGPLANIVPSYLSTAITKRWKSKGVQVLDRSLVRYIAHTSPPRVEPAGSSNKRQRDPALQIYTAKSYDFLDGCTTLVDYVVVAPSTHGPHGSATLATHEVPEYLWSSTKGRSWYQTWSQMTDNDDDQEDEDHSRPSIISCYQDDGRIVVNAELCAATHVYAAGSVAKAPNSVTGHATVTTGGTSGRIAAHNMTRQYRREQEQQRFLPARASSSSNSSDLDLDTLDPITVLRSDQRLDGGASCLTRLGVQALCVGNCDADMATHAVWWTNQAAQRRLLRARNTTGGSDDGKQQQQRTIKSPVFGIGVVFYLDSKGRIQGVMTWGIPFADPGTGELKAPLLALLKNVLHTNGGLQEVVTERDQRDMARYMEETSQQAVLVAAAASSSSRATALPRPLHRYTDIRPVRSTSGFLKRKDGGQGFGVNGENLFARSANPIDSLPPPPVPFPAAASAANNNNTRDAAAERLKALYDWTVWEQLESRWEANEQRARPTKEDPLWIRKGDETRNIPQRERIAAAYTTLLQGQTSSGGGSNST